MTKTKKTTTKAIYEDGDDAHFSDNPAVPKALGESGRLRRRGRSQRHPKVILRSR